MDIASSTHLIQFARTAGFALLKALYETTKLFHLVQGVAERPPQNQSLTIQTALRSLPVSHLGVTARA